MPSTNKTKHLGLCQWVGTDPFLREDMNETLRIIDGAFDRERLFSVTITGPTPSIVLDFSGLDLSQYIEFELRFSFKDNYARNMRINGVSDMKYINYYTGGSQSKDKIDVYSSRQSLIPQNDGYIFQPVGGGNYLFMRYSDFPSIKSLTFFGSSTTNNFAVGDVISVWGLKK